MQKEHLSSLSIGGWSLGDGYRARYATILTHVFPDSEDAEIESGHISVMPEGKPNSIPVNGLLVVAVRTLHSLHLFVIRFLSITTIQQT